MRATVENPDSIRLLFALRHFRLAQAFDDALILRVEGHDAPVGAFRSSAIMQVTLNDRFGTGDPESSAQGGDRVGRL
jgi:hypothetical protein